MNKLNNCISLKDFENCSSMTINERAEKFYEFYLYSIEEKHNNYRIVSKFGSGAEMSLIDPYSFEENKCISFVSNDYLGFTKHPKIIEAGKEALDIYGSGTGSSPLIGGQNSLHESLEKKIAKFVKKEDAITFTSGYAANCSMLLTLLGKSDIAIIDMGVHASIMEGCLLTNKKFFLHNDINSLESVLEMNNNKYQNMVIVVDGVYSQDGDVPPLDKICKLAKKYHAFLIVDDAHGIGVIGSKGKGILDLYDCYDQVDMITGTFSKTFATVGGFVAANKEIIALLKYLSGANIFSAAATPQSVSSTLKAIDLLDEEPQWNIKLKENIAYFKNGLDTLNIDYGKAQSAIFPIMIRDEDKTRQVGRTLFLNGIYANPILYPAVSRKQTRIRMSLLATHSTHMLDKALNVLESALKQSITSKNYVTT